ncbi:Vesicle-mediated ER to Golgi transport protein [Naganishia albida]|nr:Vesicle-mediated ER to Golgi transport protein [Naganishia albida]
MASLFSSKLTSAYTALRGDLGNPQSPASTIDKLVDRIQTSPSVDDRRTAVLGLKGCIREYRALVGERALESLVAVLAYDAPNDAEIAKAVLETLMGLMEVHEEGNKEGDRVVEEWFKTPEPTHSLLTLIHTSTSFYPRFYTLQLLSQLLAHRPAIVQAYLISSPPPGVDGILSVLDGPPIASAIPGAQPALSSGASEMLRNEALLLLPALLAGNADLQKIVAFSGAFEKLISIIQREGGIEGGIIVQDVLVAIGSLLRFNVSNQNYFRELSLIPLLPPMLYFPSPPPSIDTPAPDDFTLQYWPEQKLLNAGLVLGVIRMLVGSPGGGNQSAMVASGVTRCLLELALSSNAPASLKAQALNTLTPIMLASPKNQALLSTLLMAPLIAVPADEEHPQGGFIRLPMRQAAVALVGTVVDGQGAMGGRGLRGRAAGVNMFEAYVTGNDEARLGIISTMTHTPQQDPTDAPQSAGTLLLNALVETPLPGQPFDPYRPLFACLLMSHLVRNSEAAKAAAREIALPSMDDGDEDEGDALIQVIVGNLMMAAREQAECVNRRSRENPVAGATEESDWTRVMVGYLILLCTWLWDSPKSVNEFLNDSSNIQVLIGPITQSTGVDPIVQGLCAFLLGVCYEFNREPGEVTRATLYPILHSRIGPDQFVSRMARLREDARFKAVQPDQFDTEPSPPAPGQDVGAPVGDDVDEEDGLEIWFDWAFVDFWKNNYYTIQRSIAIDPDAVRGSTSEDSEAMAVMASLRAKVTEKSAEIDALHQKMSTLAKEHEADHSQLSEEIQALSERNAELTKQLEDMKNSTEAASSTRTNEAARVAELESKLTETQAKLEETEAKVAETTAKLADVEKQHEASVAETTKAREEAVAEYESKLKDLQEKLTAETTRAEQLTSSTEEGRTVLTRLEETLEAERKKVAEMEATLEGERRQSAGAHDKSEKATAQISSLEAKLKEQTALVSTLQAQLSSKPSSDDALARAKADADEEKSKREEIEKEHEDLLVLLEELSQKRKRDKAKMKESGMDVSEDEDDDDEDDE